MKRSLLLAVPVLAACGSSTVTTTFDGGTEGGAHASFSFQTSNVKLDNIDVSTVEDQDVTGSCQINAESGFADCFQRNFAATTVTQSDGSKVGIIVVKSLRVEPTAHIRVMGQLPLVLVSLTDMTILGTIDAHAESDVAYAGGFHALAAAGKGSGPGGGATGTGTGGAVPGVAGGGASYCGLGGKGAAEQGSTDVPGAPTPAYGANDIRPLIGGSSGGVSSQAAGGGGGALQFVAGGSFTINVGASINAGGGGGEFGGIATGQNAGGGGSGGSILIEAPTVTMGGTLAVNGGGGGGSGAGGGTGKDANPDSNPAAGGGGASMGGAGSAGASSNGANGNDTPGSTAGAGGGGAGRIRINTTGVATVTGTFSPSAASTCVSQGKVRAPGSGV